MASGEELDLYLEGTVDLERPSIARGEPEPVLVGRGTHQRVIDAAAGDPGRLELPTASATATLVSTKSSAVLALAGIAKRANEIVVYLRATRSNDQPPLTLLEGIARERLYPQPGAVCGHLYLPRPETNVVAHRLRDYQSPCLIDGCAHASTLPLVGIAAPLRTSAVSQT